MNTSSSVQTWHVEIAVLEIEKNEIFGDCILASVALYLYLSYFIMFVHKI